MAPKKDKEKDDLLESVNQLTESVNKLNERFDNLATDTEFKKLNTLIVELTEKVDAFKYDEQLNELDKSITHIRDTLLNNVIASNKEMCNKLNHMEKKIVMLEKQVDLNAQRCRENNIELNGIGDEIVDTELEVTVINILKKINVECFDWDIQGCHRLPMRKGCFSKPTIVKFVNRKKPEEIMKNRKYFKDKDFVDIGLSTDTKIFANINLTPVFKELDYLCRNLKKQGKISKVNTTHTSVKIKLDERYVKICHIQDLRDLFKDMVFESKYHDIKKEE